MNNIVRIIAVAGLFLCSTLAKAQLTFYPMIHAGYAYQNQSFGEVGARILFLDNDNVLYRVGAAALVGETNGEFAVMPKAQVDLLFNFDKSGNFFHPWYFLVGAETTNKYFSPKAGISILGIVDLTAGYAFSYKNKFLHNKELHGMNFNFTVNIPLVAFSK